MLHVCLCVYILALIDEIMIRNLPMRVGFCGTDCHAQFCESTGITIVEERMFQIKFLKLIDRFECLN